MAQPNPYNTPALAPPDGKPNFENPDCEAGAVYAAISILLGASSLLLLARIYTKAFVARHLDPDDYVLVVGWAAYASSVGLNYTQLPHIISCHQWDVTLVEMSLYLKDLYIAEIVYCIEILFVKLGALIQLKRIFFGTKKNLTYWLLISLIVLNSTFYVIAFFAAIFQCSPIEKTWIKTLPGKCFDVNSLIIGTAAFNVVIDFSMLALPLYSIGQLMISTRQKLGIGAIFATGLLACVASALRLAYSIELNNAEDVTFTFPNFLWASNLEIVSIIVAASFPVMPRLYKHIRGRDGTRSGASGYQGNTFHSNSTFKNSKTQRSTPSKPILVGGVGGALGSTSKSFRGIDSSSNLRDEWMPLDGAPQRQQYQPRPITPASAGTDNNGIDLRHEEVQEENSGITRTVRMETKYSPVPRGMRPAFR